MVPALTSMAKQCADGLRIQRALPAASPALLAELGQTTLPLHTTHQVLSKLEALEPVPAQALIALLEYPHLDVIMKAQRVLVERKVLAADRPMVELATRFSEAHNMEGYIGTLFQLGRLGGPESRRYLETVASGHADPNVRDVAARALKGIN